jgi:multisubunit Na+/H+ antiporter MnhC subunit
MRIVESFLAGALVLIGLYLLLSQQQTSSVIKEITTGTARIFSVLQGQTKVA